MVARVPAGKKNAKKTQMKFVIDCARPVDDNILDINSFVKFLHDRVKVDGKVGNLGNKVSIKAVGAKINVTAEEPFSKRYLKYLTKKYLKKHQLRDWMRVVASDKGTYEIKYFNINNDDDEDDE
ncbi:ribosomal protein L22e [Sphaeroforma arctica JP610]|uniref:Large ribosomal subunit protein eL22 n=1 Tax=Sphaeroforma arctica JP610 TaxID=667725 RepID=A0A0L0FU10_9EUKA|nr:ribosomal protein L22e [Sphaeroforma arctica JP610]KNC80330.1 ribosomal protein L22e [Sphaeroforma arctica JP610]|eukprot:XP_014154232.1 ribosomal protein L22e [Sphaeroforma arctica JP610]